VRREEVQEGGEGEGRKWGGAALTRKRPIRNGEIEI
jgi:hypothetical protein